MFTKSQQKALALASLGGALEFYDFVIFVFLAKIIGQLFFPKVDPLAALMATLAVFAIGYLARPIGGLIFGHFGDKKGRKRTFVNTVFLMAIPTFAIGLLPTYQHIGIVASILLVIVRLMQGLAVGGEIPGAIVFAAETIAEKRRAFATGLILLGVNMGMLSGSFISAFITNTISSQHLLSWGWRIPFFIGGVLGMLSYYLRRQLQETPAFTALQAARAHSTFPAKEIITRYPIRLLQATTITSFDAVMVSIIYLFLPTYLATFFHFPLARMLTFNTITIFSVSFAVLIASYLADIYGRKKIMLIGILFIIFFSYPLFSLFQRHDIALAFIAMLLCGFLGSFVAGVFPCMTAESFPTQVRYSGMAIAYNIGFGIFGGLTPLTVTALIHWSGNLLAPSWILILFALLALIALYFMRETYRDSLHST